MPKKNILLFLILTAATACLYFGWLALGENEATIEEIVSRTRPSDVKIFVLGIDGATFSVIEPLIAAGEPPHFKQLMSGGTYGVLLSEEPMKSPALWTTMVTGVNRNEHGIYDFLMPDLRSSEQKLVLPMSSHRKVPALWNIASQFKKTVGFTGWWASWPAEEVNGWIISAAFMHKNAIQSLDKLMQSGNENITHITYPQSLTEPLRKHIIDPNDPPVDSIRAFADFTDEDIALLKAAKKPLPAHGPSVLKFGYCIQKTLENATLDLLKNNQPDLAGILLPLVDMSSHTFWHYYEPEAFPEYNNADNIKKFKRLIPEVYKYHDRLLGRLLKELDPRTIIIILSDHGFKATAIKPKSQPATEMQDAFNTQVSGNIETGITGDHHPEGILIVSGGPIKKGGRLVATLYDIYPTILALMGLPVPEDCKGRILTDMIDASFFIEHPIKRIPSYSKILPPNTVPQARGKQHEVGVDMLRGLGYIQ